MKHIKLDINPHMATVLKHNPTESVLIFALSPSDDAGGYTLTISNGTDMATTFPVARGTHMKFGDFWFLLDSNQDKVGTTRCSILIDDGSQEGVSIFRTNYLSGDNLYGYKNMTPVLGTQLGAILDYSRHHDADFPYKEIVFGGVDGEEAEFIRTVGEMLIAAIGDTGEAANEIWLG